MKKRILEYDFEVYLSCIKKSYATSIQSELPVVSDFPNSLFESNSKINLEELETYGEKSPNAFIKSICNRILGVYNIQYSRIHGSELDIKSTWEYIANSILQISLESTISSIGSQGFLSVPLFKYDVEIESFEFLRFHIWSPQIEALVDQEKRELFSIHSHSFHAQSWIITGSLINADFDIVQNSNDSNSSLFKVEYNKSLNEVNQHQSKAINTNINVKSIQTSVRNLNQGDTYTIQEGEFHKSIQKESSQLSATFFSFNAKDRNVVQSHVLGPIDIKESSINRKMFIDPSSFISDVNKSLK